MNVTSRQDVCTTSEERKIEELELKALIIFNKQGYQVYVRLVVFDQDFHVHSVLLKLHSTLFQKFLDLPDETLATLRFYLVLCTHRQIISLALV